MKLFSTVLLLFFYAFSYCQEEDKVYMVLENVKHIENSYIIEFDLVIKNASDTTITVIKPENYFFRDHNDFDKEGYKYGLSDYSKPYSLNVLSSRPSDNIKTETANIVEATLRKPTVKKVNLPNQNQLYLLDKLIKLKPNEYRKFEKIQIEKKHLVFPFKKGYFYELNVYYFSRLDILDDVLIKKYEDFLAGNLSSEVLQSSSKKDKKKLKEEKMTAKKILEYNFKILIDNNLSPTNNLKIIIDKIKEIQSFNYINISSNHLDLELK